MSPRVVLTAGLLLLPCMGRAETSRPTSLSDRDVSVQDLGRGTPAMLELRRAAAIAEGSVRASSNENAAAANGVWVENAAQAARPVQASGLAQEAPIQISVPAPARPNLIAAPPVDSPDPLPPPNPKGWDGFKQGFLGTEAKCLSILSGAGKAALPLFLLLQPLILPAALVVGLLGIFGVRL